jgi:ketosteroid isomerase-like protein
MSQRARIGEAEIRALIEAWADAVRRHDLPAILAHHDDDIVMFDVPPPLQSHGMAAYKKTWDLFFAYHQPGQAFDVEELQMCVGDTVAFAVAIMRCGSGTVSGPPVPGGFQFRLTIGLCKVDGAWCINHEHHSVPGDGLEETGVPSLRAHRLGEKHFGRLLPAISRGKETA